MTGASGPRGAHLPAGSGRAFPTGAAGAYPAGDPRTGSDGLGWVTRALFPDPRAVLVIGRPGVGVGAGGAGPAPDGWRAAARYTVLPSARRARFLLPLGPRRVRAAALLAFNSLRPAPVRAARRVVGGLARLGALDLARLPVLTVWLPPEVRPAEALLTAYLSAALGPGPLHAACGIRPPDPNRKPTLQLFDDAGTPRGYAKVGWNPATRELARTEAAALRRLAGIAPGVDHPVVPGLLTALEWADRTVTVAAPLPGGVRGVSRSDPPRLAALLAVARRGGPPRPPAPLTGSAFLSRLAAEAQAAVEAQATGGARVRAAVRRLEQRYGSVRWEFGDWHGDWVPWNLGVHDGRLVAWDWEHSGPDVPVGFDLVHDAFHRALILDGQPVAAAVRTAEECVGRYAGPLGLAPEQRRLLVDGYLVELWLRTWRLARGGAGWNDTLHPALLDVAEQRLRQCATGGRQ